MILLWTKSNKIGSHLIRYGLEEDSSHFSMAFFVDDALSRGVVIHHNFAGFQLDWLPEFRKKNELVKSLIPKSDSKEIDRLLFRATADKFSPLDYDRPSFFYFCWRAALRRFFDKPLPKTNQWDSGKNVLCTGQARILQDHYPYWFAKPIRDFDIVTPGELYQNLLDSKSFKEGK